MRSTRAADAVEREADGLARKLVSAGVRPDREQRSGTPLDASTRSLMESTFGHDFSRVRIHADEKAADAARAVNARAFTLGQEIFFGSTQYQPRTEAGRQLFAHELAHVVQQTRGSADGLLRQTLAPEGGSAPYLPAKKKLTETLTKKTAAERKSFLEELAATILPVWLSVKASGHWEQLKGIGSVAADPAATSAIEPVPATKLLHEGSAVKTRYPDLGVRFSTGPEPQLGEAILAEQEKRQKSELDAEAYADIDDATFVTNQHAQDASLATRAIMSLRMLETVLNRFEAARLAANDPNVDYSLAETLALYQQEGNKEMPASAGSLAKGIPTGVSDSVTMVGSQAGGRIEISQGVLVLNPAVLTGMSDEQAKLLALKIYANHIGGLDVIHHQKTVDSLAKWSFGTLKALGKIANTPENPTAEADALAAAKAKWTLLRDNLQITKNTKAWVFAPADPVTFVKEILVEAMMLLRRYSDIGRVIEDTAAATSAGLPANAPMSFTYMQFNSSQIDKSIRPKELIRSVVTAARTYKVSARFKTLQEQAKLISKPNSFDDIAKWLLGKAPYESEISAQRWQMVMDFIEHAGYEDWRQNWAKMRGNASLVRTQAEFYGLVFGE